MKLTKGKLKKIYKKKKQTMCRIKNRGKNSNKKRMSKTFRKKRPLNLNKKTLKNILEIKMQGGEREEREGSLGEGSQNPLEAVSNVTNQMNEFMEESQGKPDNEVINGD